VFVPVVIQQTIPHHSQVTSPPLIHLCNLAYVHRCDRQHSLRIVPPAVLLRFNRLHRRVCNHLLNLLIDRVCSQAHSLLVYQRLNLHIAQLVDRLPMLEP
jgi:hypothetical protein